MDTKEWQERHKELLERLVLKHEKWMKTNEHWLKPCLKSSKALDGSHAYNFDGICINCGERWEKTQPKRKI